jgi:rod shape-determining protein MreD
MPRIDRTPGIRRRPSIGRRLDIAARASFPAASTAALMMLTLAPFGFAGQAALLPATALAAVYFWSLFRPAGMAPAVVFPIGILLDLLGYLPLGVGVLTLLSVHGFAARWQRVLARQSFLVVWVAFLGFAAGAAVLSWALTSLLQFRLLPAGAAVFQFVVSAAIYPTLAILFVRAQRSVAAPERA